MGVSHGAGSARGSACARSLVLTPCSFPGRGLYLAPAQAPALRPGMGAAPGALWAPGRVLGPGPWLETDASPSLQPGRRPRPATSPLPPERQKAARALFLQCFGGLLLQATPGRSPRNIIKEREGERESGRRQGPGRFGKTI